MIVVRNLLSTWDTLEMDIQSRVAVTRWSPERNMEWWERKSILRGRILFNGVLTQTTQNTNTGEVEESLSLMNTETSRTFIETWASRLQNMLEVMVVAKQRLIGLITIKDMKGEI